MNTDNSSEDTSVIGEEINDQSENETENKQPDEGIEENVKDNSGKSGEKTKKGKPKKIRRTLISRFDLLNKFKHWYMGGISITRSLFRVRAAWQGVIIISSILAVLFILAAFYTGAGEFVISLDSNMSEDGFYISDNTDFSEKRVCLRSKAVVADNINIFDISEDVDDIDGVHDGENYVAHTFYLTNETGKTKNYEYKLKIRRSAKNAEKALWVMVFFNGKQTIYAMEGADGEPEKQYSIYEFPFMEDSAQPEQYATTSGNDAGIDAEEVYQAESIEQANELITVPFRSEKEICAGTRPKIKNKGVDKYTVVMWYEGEDPECVDDIIGGWVEVYMSFDYTTD